MKRVIKKTVKKTTKKLQYVAIGLVLVGISAVQLFGATTSIATYVNDEMITEQVHAETPVSTITPIFNHEYTPTHIKIKKADIDLAVVPVALQNGTWAVNDGVANYAVETSKISKAGGNVGIYGHDLPNAFTRIKSLQYGDTIEVFSGKTKSVYSVTSAAVIDPTNVETFYPTEKPLLTLVTCSGIFSQQRYAVKAALVRIEETK